jgi:hypothetical protein
MQINAPASTTQDHRIAITVKQYCNTNLHRFSFGGRDRSSGGAKAAQGAAGEQRR